MKLRQRVLPPARTCVSLFAGALSGMTFRSIALSLAFAASALAAIAQTPPPQAKPPADLPDAPSTTAQPKPEPVPTGPILVIDTTMGRITCKTFVQQAPDTVANFIGLTEGTKDWTDGATNLKQHNHRFYDGLTFHRVIPGFMIQGGDPLGDGSGDPGYLSKDEIDPNLNFTVPGRLAMANSGPNTNGSQFFITEDVQPELNGKYTIFGQCDQHSVLLVASIARVARDKNDKPDTPVKMTHVTVVRDGQAIPPLPADLLPAATPPATTAPNP
jgi:peptidyl-prolyl cis-trans isomerase A (cyclophilin A)